MTISVMPSKATFTGFELGDQHLVHLCRRQHTLLNKGLHTAGLIAGLPKISNDARPCQKIKINSSARLLYSDSISPAYLPC